MYSGENKKKNISSCRIPGAMINPHLLELPMSKTNFHGPNNNNCRLLCHLLVILSHFCEQCGPRSDCSFRSSLTWVHTVCPYAKIGLKSLQEYSADGINRRHFQMQVFLAL